MLFWRKFIVNLLVDLFNLSCYQIDVVVAVAVAVVDVPNFFPISSSDFFYYNSLSESTLSSVVVLEILACLLYVTNHCCQTRL